MINRKRHRANAGAAIAEFGPSIFVFFLIILFPMVNLIAMAMGAATIYFTAIQCATRAGDSTDFSDALVGAESSAYEVESGGFGQFAKLVPVGGFNSSGMDLYITETNINTNVSTRFGPNVPFVGSPIDTNSNLYTYDAVVTYELGPFVNLNSVPWIGSIPGVGVPARLTYTASRNIEHPEGLQVGVRPDRLPPTRERRNSVNNR